MKTRPPNTPVLASSFAGNSGGQQQWAGTPRQNSSSPCSSTQKEVMLDTPGLNNVQTDGGNLQNSPASAAQGLEVFLPHFEVPDVDSSV